jgi:hypothetical protein
VRLPHVAGVFWSRDVAEFLSYAGGVADAELYATLLDSKSHPTLTGVTDGADFRKCLSLNMGCYSGMAKHPARLQAQAS